MKKQVLQDHREKDLRELREMLWTIIHSESTAKDKVEAAKLLSRLHHAVTPEKGEVESRKKIEKPTLRPEHKKALQEILNKNV